MLTNISFCDKIYCVQHFLTKCCNVYFNFKEKKMEEKRNGFKEFLCSGIGKAVMIVALYGIILGIFLLLIFNVETLSILYILLFCYFGWRALDRIQPEMFLIMPVGHWVIYFLVKGILSLLVGMFVTPFVIANKITQTIQESI